MISVGNSWRSRCLRASTRVVPCAVLVGLAAFLLRNWLGEGLPTSHRREVLTELAITWMFRQEIAQGHLLSEWNPIWFSGFPWLRFCNIPLI